jgi:hypothetical protein
VTNLEAEGEEGEEEDFGNEEVELAWHVTERRSTTDSRRLVNESCTSILVVDKVLQNL